MTVIFIIFLLLSALWYFERLQSQNADNKFKFNLFSLRDRLRYSEATGEIASNHWFTYYLDSTISKKIKTIYCINVYTYFFLFLRYQNNQLLLNFSNKINDELNQNSTYKSIYNELVRLQLDYLLDKSSLFRILSFTITYLIKLLKTFYDVKLNVKKGIIFLTNVPETSTVEYYYLKTN